MLWNETTIKLELKGFEDGLNDARRHTIDQTAFQINQEYRKGVEIAHQLIATLDAARDELLNRPMKTRI